MPDGHVIFVLFLDIRFSIKFLLYFFCFPLIIFSEELFEILFEARSKIQAFKISSEWTLSIKLSRSNFPLRPIAINCF